MQQQSNNNGAFIKAMIKIAHPDWTQEQIETEYLKKISETDANEDSNCEYCSG